MGGKIESLEGMSPGLKEGFSLKITPDITLVIYRGSADNLVIRADGKEAASNIEGMFVERNSEGKMEVGPGKTFALSLETRGPEEVKELTEALGTLISLGFTPEEVVDFIERTGIKRGKEEFEQRPARQKTGV